MVRGRNFCGCRQAIPSTLFSPRVRQIRRLLQTNPTGFLPDVGKTHEGLPSRLSRNSPINPQSLRVILVHYEAAIWRASQEILGLILIQFMS